MCPLFWNRCGTYLHVELAIISNTSWRSFSYESWLSPHISTDVSRDEHRSVSYSGAGLDDAYIWTFLMCEITIFSQAWMFIDMGLRCWWICIFPTWSWVCCMYVFAHATYLKATSLIEACEGLLNVRMVPCRWCIRTFCTHEHGPFWYGYGPCICLRICNSCTYGFGRSYHMCISSMHM